MRLSVQAVALIAPGLPNWSTAQPVLAGHTAYQTQPSQIPPVSRLPATERRRVGLSVKVALALAEQLFAAEGVTPPADTATLFTSSGGDGENCHILCEALEDSQPTLSPTRFTNSVHNAPAGYWSIAAQCRQPSTSLCAYDGSFAAGLLEAAVYVLSEQAPVALIAYDVPYPEPLNGKRQIAAPAGVALLLVPPKDAGPGRVVIDIGVLTREPASRMAEPALEALRLGVPALRALPLLAAITSGQSTLVCIGGNGAQVLPVSVLLE